MCAAYEHTVCATNEQAVCYWWTSCVCQSSWKSQRRVLRWTAASGSWWGQRGPGLPLMNWLWFNGGMRGVNRGKCPKSPHTDSSITALATASHSSTSRPAMKDRYDLKHFNQYPKYVTARDTHLGPSFLWCSKYQSVYGENHGGSWGHDSFHFDSFKNRKLDPFHQKTVLCIWGPAPGEILQIKQQLPLLQIIHSTCYC